ncbi:MAG: DUF4952 domain-containing protein [Bradyrhizobiaceae bacterium]|nr:DUF4952 domain-containing protein [Bradyrhizobiaceae bacterium]
MKEFIYYSTMKWLLGDFLRNLGLRRADVQFVKCDHIGIHDSLSNTLQAVYRVGGKDIANVELWLVKFAHVSKLKFICCGCETSVGSFTARDGAEFTTGMGGETIENDAIGAQIPYLNLYVTHYFHEP